MAGGPTRKPSHRRPGESEEEHADRLAGHAAQAEQAWDEVRNAIAMQGLTLTEVARRLGGQGDHPAMETRGGPSLAKLADIGRAIEVDFKLVAIPHRDHLSKPQLDQERAVREMLAFVIAEGGQVTVRQAAIGLYGEWTNASRNRAARRLELLAERGELERSTDPAWTGEPTHAPRIYTRRHE